MSSQSELEAPGQHKRLLRGKRGKLRNGTWIVPSTGERVHRAFTLLPSEIPRPDEWEPPYVPRHASQVGFLRRSWDGSIDHTREFGRWLRTPAAKGILKCSIAYTLGSMATFTPYLANYLGHQDGKHVVATITVYFHPARSAGSMVEGVMLALAAFLYFVFIAVSSMATGVFCEAVMGYIELGYALILIVFVGGGLGFIGWTKLKLDTPLVSVACSLASLAIISVLTKENAVHTGVFDNHKIVQVAKMVMMGTTMTAVVNSLIWPVKARTQLRESMINVSDCYGDMLTMITRGFLSGSEIDLRSQSFDQALARYKTAVPLLSKHLHEAKLEHYILGTEDEYKLEASLVQCLQRLAQSIGGLRSAATTQFSLIREHVTNTPVAAVSTRRSSDHSTEDTSYVDSIVSPRGEPSLTAIEEAEEDGSQDDVADILYAPRLQRHGTESSLATLNPAARTPSEIFARFITYLGPSMKSLAYTLMQILSELPFGEGPDYKIAINGHFSASLADALSLYSEARDTALQELYKSKELDKTRPESVEADFEEVAASCGYFSFNLQDFAIEMQNYLAILEELKEEIERPNRRSWKWLLFWRKARKGASVPDEDPEQEALLTREASPDIDKNLTEIALGKRAYRNYKVERKTFRQHLWLGTLDVLRVIKRDDVRFAFKVGIGAAIYAMFAFIPATRPFYSHWRGEWGLVSYMLVCSMTVGASNTTGWGRFIGTIMGATAAIIVWVTCQGNPWAMAFCGFILSMPCFYLITTLGQGPFGRFILLTYNVSCLYAYSLSVKDSRDDEDEGGINPIITEIALHRVLSVACGVLWGMFVTRVIWPISARRKFRDGLSVLWLRMGLIWKRDPLSTLLEGQSDNQYMNIGEEFALQRYVFKLDGLRKSAASEFELRGAFPSAHYSHIMESTAKILDAFHAMNIIIQKTPTTTEGEAILLRYTSAERALLCSRISHLLQVIASSMKLEYPLNNAVPTIDITRDRLLAKIFQYRKAEKAEERVRDEDYEVLYAFILVTGQLAAEISRVEKEVEDLFGVLDEDLLELR